MGLKECIDDAVAAGEMDPVRAEEAQRLIDDLEAEFLDELGLEGARIRAGIEAEAQIRAATAETRRQTLIDITVRQKMIASLRSTVAEQGLDGLDRVSDAVFDSLGMEGVKITGASQLYQAMLGRAHSRMGDVLETFKRNLAGNPRNRARLDNVVREAFGEDTGDKAAKALAKSWYEASEFLRGEFNKAGGHIGKLERWGLPQGHDTVKIRQAGFDAWRDFIQPRLDRARMVDGLTGKPFSDAQLELVLRDVYETISTDGFSKILPGGRGGRGKLGNARADHRFLHFGTADDWLRYQEKFGGNDPFSTMTGHIDGMARDIGLMQALGTNPVAGLRFLQQTLRKDASAKAGRANARAKAGEARLDNLYANYTGNINSTADGLVARTLQGTRSGLNAVLLGSAALSALSDLAFSTLTARFNGISATKVMARQVRLLIPGNTVDRNIALRSGLIAEEHSRKGSAQLRYVGEVMGPELMRTLSDGVLRVSGLSAWTQSGRWAFGMEFMGLLADHAGKAAGDIPGALRRTLKRYNISKGDWDVIRRTAIWEPDQGGFLRPDDIAARADLPVAQADELATRVLAMIQAETEFAVPSTSLRGRAAFLGANKPGTVVGELLRSTAMFKSFSVTLWQTHINRLFARQGLYNKAVYGAALFGSATLMGALVVQLKEISKGRDPRAMFGKGTAAFWLAAAAQGGGLGIFGDFALSDVNRFGASFGETLAGPVVGFANDAFRLTGGNLREALEGKDPKIGADIARFARRYTPGGSIWYARAAFERLVVDQIQQAIDPDAKRGFDRQVKRLRSQTGQRFFAPPGGGLPDRLPDIGAAFQ